MAFKIQSHTNMCSRNHNARICVTYHQQIGHILINWKIFKKSPRMPNQSYDACKTYVQHVIFPTYSTHAQVVKIFSTSMQEYKAS